MTDKLEVGLKLKAMYTDGEFYSATVTAISDSKKRSKAPVQVEFAGYDGKSWLSLDELKSKRLPQGKGGGKGSIDALVKFLGQQGAIPGGGKWTNDENTLFVAGLPPDTDTEHIYSMFSGFGAIMPQGAYVQKDKTSGECMGYAFVNFSDPSATMMAINALNDAPTPWGAKLTVKIKNDGPKKGKGDGGGKSKGKLKGKAKGKSHVSTTIIVTKILSKTNHASHKQWLLYR